MADDEDHLELRAVEDTLNERAPKRAWNAYEYARDLERNRRRRGLPPKPLIAPRPIVVDDYPAVSFITFHDSEAPRWPSWARAKRRRSRPPNPGQSRAGHESSGKRSAKTLAEIADAEDRLRARGVEPTPKNIADESGLHRSTVDRRLRQRAS